MGHVVLSNVMILPIFFQERISFLIAVANKRSDYTHEDLAQVDGFASNVQIVLEHQKAQDNLKKSEERYRELVEGTSDLIMRTDHQGHFVFVNHMARVFFGLPPEELIGLSSISFIHPDDKEKSYAEIETAIHDQSSCLILENRLISKTGAVHEVYWTINLHYNDLLKYSGSSAIGRDITRRKKNEENQIKIKKLEATGLLAGGIAHDFNNLLFVVTGNIELIKAIAKPDGKILRYLEQAEQATFRAIDLTRKFITFSSGGEPVKTPILIDPVILEVKDLVLSGSNISCECFLENGTTMIRADKGQIRQVFSTIIDNARNAMPNGGKLLIRSEVIDTDHEKSVTGMEIPKGRYVKVTISDTGHGIKSVHLSKVFDPYFTTREKGAKKGLGLGLAIVHSILKKHEGHIHIDSIWEKGTTVFLFLPVSSENAPMAESVLEKEIRPRKKKILLMDDEAQIRTMSQEILEGLGYGVATASNGEEAVAEYQKAMQQERAFDAVLLDLTIKGGMGGIETLKHLIMIHPEVKGIIFSGYAADPIMSDYSRHGFKAALIKPVSIPLLHETIEKVLSGSY